MGVTLIISVLVVTLVAMSTSQRSTSTPQLPLSALHEPPTIGSTWRHARLPRSAALQQNQQLERPPVNTSACLITASPDGEQCGGRKICYVCPNITWRAAVEATGLLPVRMLGAQADGTDDSEAVRATLNATQCCGGCAFFSPGVYSVNSTVIIHGGGGCIKGATGSNTAVAQSLATTAGNSVLIGLMSEGPTLAIIDADDGVLLQDLNVKGGTMGVLIRGGAGIRFNNVYVEASKLGDHVDTSAANCRKTGCNVVLGSMNAALVVENCFWLWFEHSAFAFYGGTGSRGCPGGPGSLPCDWGQRPTVILRGAPRCSGDCPDGPRPRGMPSSGLVEEVYLVRFEKVIFGGGGVQYQQTSNQSTTAGWIDFVSCTQETSAVPLLDLQSAPNVTNTFPGTALRSNIYLPGI